MLSKTLFALFAGAALAQNLPVRAEGTPRCAVPHPTDQQLKDSELLGEIESLRAKLGSNVRRAGITVDTYFHVVSSNKSKFITEAKLQKQLEYMNAAYAPHGITFKLVGTDFTVNTSWAAGGGEIAMKTKLRKGDYKTLNAYFVDVAKLDGDEALGYCFFPESGVATGSSKFIRDGCVIVAETVPGGKQAPYNLGGTLVHEVGHWFNLYHTFQDGCNGGDLVDDTPAQASATSGCPKSRDSCTSKAGLDPIHNYMDYSDDACYEEFTAGQESRMHSSWEAFRA